MQLSLINPKCRRERGRENGETLSSHSTNMRNGEIVTQDIATLGYRHPKAANEK